MYPSTPTFLPKRAEAKACSPLMSRTLMTFACISVTLLEISTPLLVLVFHDTNENEYRPYQKCEYESELRKSAFPPRNPIVSASDASDISACLMELRSRVS